MYIVYTFFDFCQFYELRLSMTIEKYHPKSLKTAITSLLYFYTVFQKTWPLRLRRLDTK